MSNKVATTTGSLASGLGKGLIAGLAGTVAITVSQMIEMKLSGRKPSTVPADAASKVLDVKSTSKAEKQQFAQEVHWAYGTSWGVARAIVAASGLKGAPAILVHFAAVWGTALVMQPGLKVAPPVSEWEPKTLAVDALHHAVYATAAGLTYDFIED